MSNTKKGLMSKTVNLRKIINIVFCIQFYEYIINNKNNIYIYHNKCILFIQIFFLVNYIVYLIIN